MKKQLPLFERIDKIQGNKAIFDVELTQRRRSDSEERELLMSPYTEYIPISYLKYCQSFNIPPSGVLSGIKSRLPKNSSSHSEFLNKWNRTNLSGLYYTEERGDYEDNLKQLPDKIKKYIEFDKFQELAVETRYSIVRRERLFSYFRGEGNVKFTQRTYRGTVSPYTLIVKQEEELNPYILAVTSPENLIYHKYNILTNNQMDMSKTIIFIANELEQRNFPNKPVQKISRELTLIALESGAQVWRVPLSYIKETCFVKNKYELESINIFERKREIEELIRDFYSMFSDPEEGVPEIAEDFRVTGTTPSETRPPLEELDIMSDFTVVQSDAGRWSYVRVVEEREESQFPF